MAIFIEYAVISVYGTSLALIVLLSLGQLALMLSGLRQKRRPEGMSAGLPSITIQLPVYNEAALIPRLIKAVNELDYPPQLIGVQILDDSTDDTPLVITQVLEQIGQTKFNFQHIRRPHREGFKAGALQNGLQKARGEFIAIFDADFLPEAGFLKMMIGHFTESNIGMVQARWGHLNAAKSWLTRMQQIALDGHFLIEQQNRWENDCFISFNGTAGIWRKSCIEDAGGWEASTLTEDLDLSYRAQLKGWKFIFCQDIIVPAELPDRISAFKTQQFRWVKGGIETSMKILPQLFHSNQPWKIKFFGFFHLTGNFVYLLVLLSAILSLPALIIKNRTDQFSAFFDLSVFLPLILLISLSWFWIALRSGSMNQPLKTLSLIFPFSMLVLIGLSLNNSKAIWEAVRGRKSAFHRTPKGPRQHHAQNTTGSPTAPKKKSLLPEAFFIIYFAIALLSGILLNDHTFLAYHLMLICAFLTVSVMDLREKRQGNIGLLKAAGPIRQISR